MGKKLIASFGLAAIVMFAFLVVGGWDRIINVLSQVDVSVYVFAILSTLISLLLWSITWHRILRLINSRIKLKKVIIIFFSATFANYVTPFGQVGGEAFMSHVLYKNSRIAYERCFATVLALDIIRLAPFFTFAFVGLIYLFLHYSLNQSLQMIILALLLVAMLIPTVTVVFWYNREFTKRLGVKVGNLLRLYLGNYSEKFERYFYPENIVEKIDTFFQTLEIFLKNKGKLLSALVLSYAGWFFFALPLYISAVALGISLPLMLVFIIIPSASMAGFTPLPGGLGGVEAVIALLIVMMTGISAPSASAISLLYRLSVYWFIILIGGLSSLFISKYSLKEHISEV